MHDAVLEFRKPSAADRILSLFADVRAGEGVTVILLMVNIFTLLTAYYIIKPVREALILEEAGAEIKSYASAGQALLFLLIIPAYGMLGSRVNRLWLINGVTAFFISNLAIFFLMGRLGFSLGIIFYLWVGLFNLMLVAQFWAFANDLYTQRAGERLFGVVGIGASLGAIFGALVAGSLFEPVGAYVMMLLSAALLGLCMILTNWIHYREKHVPKAVHAPAGTNSAEAPLRRAGGFHLITKNRYLLLIAFLVLISNCVNTTGEFILGKTVETSAQAMTSGQADAAAAQKNYIGQFYANFYFWVNLIGAALQVFVVSRLMQHLGAGATLLLLPILALGGYTLLAVAPILSLIRVAKIGENAVDYSVQNTARHALFLPTSREAKYKAKAAIDSFFWRMGDTLSGVLVFVGTQLALTLRTFATVNVMFVVIWLGVVLAIIRRLKVGRSATRIAA